MSDISFLQIVLFVVSAILLITAIVLFRSTKRFLKSSKTASGTVLDNVCETDIDGSPCFYPRFAFNTLEGREIVVQSGNGTNPASFHKGQSIVVLYDSAKPEHSRINTFGQLWLGPITCVLVGVVLLCIDLVLISQNS